MRPRLGQQHEQHTCMRGHDGGEQQNARRGGA
jgi:hypothetical protein